MTGFQIAQLAIGTCFAAVLVLFLVVAYFKKVDLTHAQWLILRVLSALCAASAAVFLTGSAFFESTQSLADGGKVAISGTAGFALFLVIWFSTRPPQLPVGPPSFSFSLPTGWSFEHAANAIASADKRIVDFGTLTLNERSALLRPTDLQLASPRQALEVLQSLAVQKPIRKYDVADEAPYYRILVRS